MLIVDRNKHVFASINNHPNKKTGKYKFRSYDTEKIIELEKISETTYVDSVGNKFKVFSIVEFNKLNASLTS